ncbi:MAG TPA: hypothetical protein VE046_17660 [Steroidobacteraceae bacterium]|nr:hypothetical protein [Steroidobacteraceae bacterium]
MSTTRVRYRFNLPNGERETFDLFFDGADFRLLNPIPKPVPFWADLSFNRCENCPLSAAEHPACPAAAQLVGVVERIETLVSYDELRVDVLTAERSITQTTTAQQALASLFGLILSTSGCPRTAFLRPMARFHLPLANELETLYRSVTMHLLDQHFRRSRGESVADDFSGLKAAYGELHPVNRGIAKRLRAASRSDPALNAVTLLDTYASLLPNTLDQSLAELDALFSAGRAAATNGIPGANK